MFSIGYAVVRTIKPRGSTSVTKPRSWQLVVIVAAIAVASYAVRFAVPLGVEVWRLALGQAPAWLAGFTLGALGAERGWFNPIDAAIARRARLAAWSAAGGCALFVGTAIVLGAEMDSFAGGGTWQSLVIAGIEGVLVVAMSLWLLDVFRRRFNHQGLYARRASRAAYAAFVIHQLVLVELVLATRQFVWSPEVHYLVTVVLGVAGSFLLAFLRTRLPGVSRVI